MAQQRHSEFTAHEKHEIERIVRRILGHPEPPAEPAPALPTDDVGKVLISQGDGTPPVFSNRPTLVGSEELTPSTEPWLAFRYDNNPGRREHRIGYDGASGGFYFALTDKTARFKVLIGEDRVYFGASPTSAKLVIATDADIVITPSGGGGAGKIDLGRRVTDDNPAVGAQVRCWSVTGQETPPFAVLVPGGASARYAIFADGHIERDGQVLGAVLTGSSDPDDTIGIDGDLYVNTSSGAWFGPKDGTDWPAIPTP